MQKPKRIQLVSFLILALAVLLRFPFISALPFDSDQAIVGLMAKHITQGEFPPLYYGDSYGGILEPALVSFVFHLLGVTRFTLHLIPFVFSILLLISIFQLGRELYNREVGLLSLLMAAVPLYYMGLYSALANGGYIEILWLGNCLLLCSHRLGTQRAFPFSPPARFFSLGFFGGLAWWSHPLSITYLITCSLFLLIKEQNFIRKGWFVFSAIGFFFGSLPFWIWNGKYGLPFFHFIQSSERVAYGTKLVATYKNILEFFGLHLRGEWPVAIYLFVILIIISLIYPFMAGKKWRTFFPQSQGPGLLLIFSLVFLGIYSGSRFNEEEVLRYLLPFYSLFPISLALFLYGLKLKRAYIPLALLIGILCFQLHGYWLSVGLYQNQKVKNQKLSEGESALFNFLKKKNIRVGYSPEYWNGARLTFDRQEDPIVALVFNDRYPLYTLLTDASSNPAFILDGKYPKTFESMFQAMGGTYKKEVFSYYKAIKGYVVYYDFKPPENHSTEILPDLWMGKSNSNPASVGRAFDRDASTGWSSPSPQRPGMFYQLDLGKVHKLNRIVFSSRQGKEWEFPNDYRLELSINGSDWVELSTVNNNWACLFWSEGRPFWKLRNGRLENNFQPREARFIKMTLTGPSSYNWTIGEIFVYKESGRTEAKPVPTEALISFLYKEKIAYVYADIGLSARLTHLTRGKIKCLQDDYAMVNASDYVRKGYDESYPYGNNLKRRINFSLSPAFVIRKENNPSFLQTIQKLKRSWKIKTMGDYLIYYGFIIPEESSPPIPKDPSDDYYWTGTHLLTLPPAQGAQREK